MSQARLDPELSILQKICYELEKLEPSGRTRAITWLSSKYLGESADPEKSPDKISDALRVHERLVSSAQFTKALQRGTKSDLILLVLAELSGVEQKLVAAEEIGKRLQALGVKVSNTTKLLKDLAKKQPSPLRIEDKGRYKEKLYAITEVGLKNLTGLSSR